MSEPQKVLVIGGGIVGIQASLDLANREMKVYLVEKTPSIGGRMAQLDKTFPTLDCSICILAPKMIDCLRHPNIELLTYSEVVGAEGSAGNFTVKVLKKPRYIDEEKCTGCDECTKVCPVLIPSEFDMGLVARKAIYRPFPQAVPNIFTIDKRGIPPCRAACPAGVNAQGYIALIAQDKFKEALELIRRDNPFPVVCGKVCFHPCESECERGEVDEPVAIRALKRFVSDKWLEEGVKKPEPVPKTHEEKVAVIGSGPAGLTCAYFLVKRGYPVTVFESLPELGGMLKVGIPEFRLPRKAIDAEISYIKNLGVEIRTNTKIGKDLTIDDLSREYKTIFIATGAHKSRKLGVEGEELKGVIHALNLLRDVKLGKEVKLGEKVAVIGGGNTAIDAAMVALRLGAKEVHILYRRSREEMPANPEEVQLAEDEGIRIQFLVTPKRVLGEEGRMKALECIRMELGAPDETGRRRPMSVEGSEFVMEFDTLIIAIGEQPDLFPLPKEIEVTKRNTIAADPETLQTNLPSIFAGGDVVSGPANVIEAIAAGKKAAGSIDRYLMGEPLAVKEEIKKVEEVPKEAVVRKPRQPMPLLPVHQRVYNFNEIELGFSEEMAKEEATRCLMCGGCSECLECEKVCEPKAIIHDQKEELIELNVGAIVVATGFDLFDVQGISEYGYGRYKDVLTSLEFERLLCASGPTGGHLVRLSDKRVPERIVFIQCVGSRSERGEIPYCSSVCCAYATKEAILIKEHEPKCDVQILYMDLRVFGKGFQEFVNRAEKEWGVKYTKGRPSRIEEDPKTGNLLIRYEDMIEGEIKEIEADLVVLCPALIPRRENEKLSEILKVKLDEYGFFKSKDVLFGPVETNIPGIFICGYGQGPKDIPESVAQASGAAAKAAEVIAIAGGSG